MASLAVAPKRRAGNVRLVRIDSDEVDVSLGDEQVEVADAIRTVTLVDDHRCLEEGVDRKNARVGRFDGSIEVASLCLVPQDCH